MVATTISSDSLTRKYKWMWNIPVRVTLVNIYIFEHYLEIIVNWLDWEAYIFARVGSSPTLKTKIWTVSYNWLEHLIVNQGVTGSSPVQSASFL